MAAHRYAGNHEEQVANDSGRQACTASSSKSAPRKTSGTKRKAAETKTPATKKQKTQPSKVRDEDDVNDESKDGDNASDSITINRAPVLELWSSCVAQFLHPSLPWSTALSVGSAISTITAISKGRSIGTIDKPDASESSEKCEKRTQAQADLGEIDVVSFHLKIKDGSAVVGDKPKKGNEETLKKRYGEGQYQKAKKTFQEALEQWKGKGDELDRRAFHMYEDFRPSVPNGQKGWGRKGQLNLDSVRSAIAGG
ncbi:hypothetical protein CLAFUW4_10457 [Fulvia fulva]|uniref:Uncharacterized protein n=1 Tax=Passalora fulva TaxID=5499 RepID=A0A9Q8LFS5_PASFU|nr:uncharacterized protein CLAFUR5_05073 [Fulvia fulva]KAK4615711.1 hypothetical protein CLAFUR4_10461 [Fulvia fulva]KAK4616782.1 hypothetical protein CLAFUR0_10462 [Fulvia fulva]UJO16616.1 hypothetical protein CLAFUR5_05073 [Fulvia fulva]WPV19595.1 hypothetical protein CLAFUW4_10457 [Fulvia fulva]WPV34610.1 hypothetical protein CLAFUW7_10457 [Fulvia fulva]